MKLVVFSISGTINFKTALAFWENSDHWVDEQEDIIVDFQAVVDHCNNTCFIHDNLLYAACKAAWKARSFHQVLFYVASDY